ncbi:MAG: aminotransferase class I/II-fold pyridoxal phosphate-dependent enzyme [Thermoanaerobaculia bacterium]
MKGPEEVNQVVRAASPALFDALSDLGRRLAYPPDIPFQAAQARGKTFNGTIGQITDGRGAAISLPSMSKVMAGLGSDDLSRAFLYSPVPGIEEVRERWREWQRRGQPDSKPSTLPQVTNGLAHGLSIVADLFAGEGTPLAVPKPFWGNYRQTFVVRRGATLLTAPVYVDGRFNPGAIAEALGDRSNGRPAIAILNLPTNPSGYSPTADERRELARSLAGLAEKGPLVVVCDDAYAGLVFEEEIPRESMFWDLIGQHENLIPVKVDGATKEFAFFGGRVGFLTFAQPPDSDIAAALDSKVKCLVRATVGSPVSPSQMVLLQALREVDIAKEVEAVRLLLQERYSILKQALAGVDGSLLRPLPFNSGCFALIEIPTELGLESEQVRQHLLEHHDTGVVAVAPNFIRIAFCSVRPEALGELVRRVELAVSELAK